MSMLIVSHDANGKMEVSIGGFIDACDKVCLCFHDHQRQPFLLRGLDEISAEDIALAFHKTRGKDIGLLPVNTENSVSFEIGSPNQARLVRDGLRPFFTTSNLLIRNLLVVAFERPDGEIVPFTNMLPHQWYDDSVFDYRVRISEDATRLHFFLCSSLNSLDATRNDFEPMKKGVEACA